MASHVFGGVAPDGQQHTLTLVVARTVGVWSPEVTEGDGAVDRRDDVAEGDGPGFASQHVAAADPSFRLDETSALEGEEDLFEIRLWEAGTCGDVADRDRSIAVIERQREQRPAGVVPSGRHAHDGAS